MSSENVGEKKRETWESKLVAIENDDAEAMEKIIDAALAYHFWTQTYVIQTFTQFKDSFSVMLDALTLADMGFRHIKLLESIQKLENVGADDEDPDIRKKNEEVMIDFREKMLEIALKHDPNSGDVDFVL